MTRTRKVIHLADPTPVENENLTDAGNAREFVHLFGGVFRWVPQAGSWLSWTGIHWRADTDGVAMRTAKQVAQELFARVVTETDPDRRKRLFAHAQRTEQLPRLQALLELAKSEIGMTTALQEFDADPFVLCVKNCVVDLRSGEQRRAKSREYLSLQANAEFDAHATCPTWDRFLATVMGGDEAAVRFLQRAIGYSLTGDTSEQVLFLLHGTGANGKTTFLKAVRTLLGSYATACSTETLLTKRGDNGIPNDLARLAGARFVDAVETEDGRRLAEAQVKALTGGDPILARFLHREFFVFEPRFKLWLATNHLPQIRGDDHAIWRRIRKIPFAVTISADDRDPHLFEQLARELPGMLNWAIAGCLAWQRDGLQAPACVLAATADYRADMDRIGQWIAERCVLAAGATVQAGIAFKDYRIWSDARGEHALPLTAFGMRLTDRGIKKVRSGNVVYRGIGLRTEEFRTASDSSDTSPGFPPMRNELEKYPKQLSKTVQTRSGLSGSFAQTTSEDVF